MSPTVSVPCAAPCKVNSQSPLLPEEQPKRALPLGMHGIKDKRITLTQTIKPALRPAHTIRVCITFNADKEASNLHSTFCIAIFELCTGLLFLPDTVKIFTTWLGFIKEGGMQLPGKNTLE